MISNQTIKASIDKLKAITKIDFSVRSLDGYVTVATDNMEEISPAVVHRRTARSCRGFIFSR